MRESHRSMTMHSPFCTVSAPLCSSISVTTSVDGHNYTTVGHPHDAESREDPEVCGIRSCKKFKVEGCVGYTLFIHVHLYLKNFLHKFFKIFKQKVGVSTPNPPLDPQSSVSGYLLAGI